MLRLLPICLLWLVSSNSLVAPAIVAAEPPPTSEQLEFFEKQVRPLLIKNCYECHSDKKQKGDLRLDSQSSILAGGESGAAIVPGNPAESLLIQAVNYESFEMPPGGQLAENDIATLTEWVRMGAPWPGDESTAKSRPREKITDEDRQYWAFQSVRNPPLPEVGDGAWSRNPIDRFIRSRLDAEAISPSPPAERLQLVRRVYFDLIGLPPTPTEVDAFVNDSDPQAYENLIDRLLENPHYGERWARHWLDLVRYAESDGFRIDDYRPNAWRYRDYVVRAFNNDKPYDQFVREQLAGDELAPDDPEAVLGTSFLRLGIYEYNNRDVRGQWQNMLDDITDVTSDVFLGIGMGCARCHDHKFDPILQKDYYRLQAFMAAIMPRDDLPLATVAEQQAHQNKLDRWEAKTTDIRQQLEALEKPVKERAYKEVAQRFTEEFQELLKKPHAECTPLEQQVAALAYRQVTYDYDRLDRMFNDKEKQQLVELRNQLALHAGEKPEPLPVALTVRDVGPEPPPTFIPRKAGEPIEPGYLTVLDPAPAEIVPPPGLASTGRRSVLANWLTRPDHPLTSRVIVNRVWQYHFGRGLVTTASDFGRLGDPPSHPELLDWLATRFVQEGWSFKKLHRRILTSQTYQQSSLYPAVESAIAKDPENRWLWRMPNRRLDAEQVRDALLAVTGTLDPGIGGPAVESARPRRSIYCRVLRNSRDPLIGAFDGVEGFQSTAQRNVTTTPTQALLMINGEVLLEKAAALASRLEREHPHDASAQIDSAVRLAYGRNPTSTERSFALQFLEEQSKRIQPDNSPTIAKLEKLPYRDGNAIVLSPRSLMQRAEVPPNSKLPTEDFTIEGFVVLHSLFSDGTVRTIAAHGSGEDQSVGWSLGVTSLKSRFKPQMLVLQLWGENSRGEIDYEPVFSSLHIELNKPYFVAAAVTMRETGPEGVRFYAKDLSNDDEPLQSSQSPHRIVQFSSEPRMFTIGGCGDKSNLRGWDGLMDDVRLSNRALSAEQLLLTSETTAGATVGYWQFEPSQGIFRDSSENRLDIQNIDPQDQPKKVEPGRQALIDFCHVLLNGNEFLYVD